jgi:hypothetical protein
MDIGDKMSIKKKVIDKSCYDELISEAQKVKTPVQLLAFIKKHKNKIDPDLLKDLMKEYNSPKKISELLKDPEKHAREIIKKRKTSAAKKKVVKERYAT